SPLAGEGARRADEGYFSTSRISEGYPSSVSRWRAIHLLPQGEKETRLRTLVGNSSSEIPLDHHGVGADLVEGAFGEDGAFGEAGDAGAEGAHEAHVVLDDDDGTGAGDGAEEGGGFLGLAVGHAGDRLVDQQELGVLGEQHADLEPLLLAVAEAGGEVAFAGGEADGVEDLVDAGDVVVSGDVGEGGEDAARLVQGELEVVPDGVRSEERRVGKECRA